MTRARSPRAHTCSGARLHQVNRRHAAEVVPLAVAGEVTLMSAPTHLGRLRALAHEAVDRPGVDELANLLRNVGRLRVALGDVYDLDAEPVREVAPVAAGSWVTCIDLRVGGDVEKRLLDEMGHQPRIRTMGEHGRRRTGVAGAQSERFLAQRIVSPAGGRHGWIGVTTRPGL